LTRHLMFPPIIGRNRQSQKCERFFTLSLEEPDHAGELLPAGRPGAVDRGLHHLLQQPPVPREPRQSHAGRRLLRWRPGYHRWEETHQRRHYEKNDAWRTCAKPLNINTRSQSLRYTTTAPASINLTMDMLGSM
jgi:hypothetical protein